MSKFYSKSTKGFYDEAFNKIIPTDAVKISDEEWMQLLKQQSKGKRITADANGRPQAIEAQGTPP